VFTFGDRRGEVAFGVVAVPDGGDAPVVDHDDGAGFVGDVVLGEVVEQALGPAAVAQVGEGE
jgi:hypothetical protein